MAHFRFRRSFGNVGTRRFRGARPSATTPPTPPPQSYSRLLFSGATSALGGTDYQMGQLIHNVTIDASGNSSVSVSKTASATDVDISNFDNTGTVSANLASSFVIRAIGNRNEVNSAIQGANTNDSVGVVGQGNPGKIDIFNGNDTELINFEVVNLNAALTISIKKIYVTRANFVGTVKPLMVLTPFPDLSLSSGYVINSSGATIFPINVDAPDMDLVGTGTGVNGSFQIGVSDSGAPSDVGYGLYAIDFDVTTTPVQLFSNAAGDTYVNAAGDSYAQP